MRPRAARCARRWRASPNRAPCRAPRSAAAFAIPSFASTGIRPAPCPSRAAPGPSSRRRAATPRRSRSRASSASTCSSSCGRSARSSARVIEVGISDQEIPYPFVTEAGDEFIHGDLSVSELARHFPTPVLANVGDEIADGTWVSQDRAARPLALFDALRVDYSLRRLIHYTGTDWRTIQPWILATNYQRYVDHFLTWAMEELAKPGGPYTQLVLPGGAVVRRGEDIVGGRSRRAGRSLASLPDAGLQPAARRRQRRRDASSISASARPTPRRRPTISRCCVRIAG